MITTTMITTTTATTVVVAAFFVSSLLRIALGSPPSEPQPSEPPPTPALPSSTPVALNETVTVASVDGLNASRDHLGEGDTIGGHVLDSGTLLRTFYVFVGVTLIIVVYFVVRSLRLRCRKNRKMKYGLLATNDDALEMKHLEEDDDEDATVFDRTLSNSRR